jgi:hypothetical protein
MVKYISCTWLDISAALPNISAASGEIFQLHMAKYSSFSWTTIVFSKKVVEHFRSTCVKVLAARG